MAVAVTVVLVLVLVRSCSSLEEAVSDVTLPPPSLLLPPPSSLLPPLTLRTYCAGFVGKEVCAAAVKRGYEVTSLSRRGAKPTNPGMDGTTSTLLDGVKWVGGDATSYEVVAPLVEEGTLGTTAHRSPLTTHHAPRTTHRSPLTMHHAPRTTRHSPLHQPSQRTVWCMPLGHCLTATAGLRTWCVGRVSAW